MDFDKFIDRRNTRSIKYDRVKEVFGTEDILPMWVADMDFATPDFILNSIKNRLEHPILGYSFRDEVFSNAFKGWAKRRYNLDVENQWITFSPGVVAAIFLTILALTEKGDKIIIQPPVYPPFFETVKKNGRILVENPLKLENGRYEIDFDDLLSKIDDKTKLIIISNPHNPVGRAWQPEELKQLAEICIKKGIYIFSDDIHSDFIFSESKYYPLIGVSDEAKDITITAYSPSKTFNVAGLTTSVVVIPNKELRNKYNTQLAASHLFLGNIFGAEALIAAYENGDEWLDNLLNYLQRNRDLIFDFISTEIPDIKIIKPESTFLMWLDFSDVNLDHSEIEKKLIFEAKLGFNNGLLFGKQGYKHFRMNFGTQRKNVEIALNRLKKVFG